MPATHDASGVSEQFDVVILSFEAQSDAPEAGLKRVFGLDDQTAQRVLSSLPATVQRGVNRVRAEYFRKVLGSIGAQVEVRNPRGEVEPPPPAPVEAPKAANPRITPPQDATRIELNDSQAVKAEAVRAMGVQATDRPPASPGVVNVKIEPQARFDAPNERDARNVAFGATQVMPSSPQPLAAQGASPNVAAVRAGAQAADPDVLSISFGLETALEVRAPANATLKEAVKAPVPGARPQTAEARDPAWNAKSAPTALSVAANAAKLTPIAASAARTELAAPATAKVAIAPPAAAPTAPEAAQPATQRAAQHNAFRFGDTNAPFIPPAAEPHAVARARAQQPISLPEPMHQPLSLAQNTAQAPPPSAASAPQEPAAEGGTGETYGGFSWGELDRGRLSDRPRPSSIPPSGGKHSSSAPPAAAASAETEKQNVRFKISKGIDPNAPVPAPNSAVLAAAIRKQRIQRGDSGLGDTREEGLQLPMLGRYENDEDEPIDDSPAANAARNVAQARANKASGKPQTAGRAVGAPRGASTRNAKRAAAQAAQEAVAAPPPDPRTFTDSIADAVLFPVRGEGTSWIMFIAVWSIAVAAASWLASFVPYLGLVITFLAITSLLAMCADFHRRCMWTVAAGAQTVDPPPQIEPARTFDAYVRAGLHVSVFVVVSQLPLVLWTTKQALAAIGTGENPFHLVLSPIFWLLACGPGFYWPMAVTTASFQNDYAGVWNVPLGVRAIVRAPAQHLVIVLLGGLAFMGTWALFLLMGLSLDMPAAYFIATVGLPLALGHGVMGALSGHLVRTRADAFK